MTARGHGPENGQAATLLTEGGTVPKRNRDRERKRDKARAYEGLGGPEEESAEMPQVEERQNTRPPSFGGSLPLEYPLSHPLQWFRRNANARRNDG